MFTSKQNELALIAKAFAHPARIAIIEHLIRANRCINSDLVEELGLAQATISQHLRELKEIGIIQGVIALIRSMLLTSFLSFSYESTDKYTIVNLQIN